MKLFTVEEANALLPTVRGVVRRIQSAYARVSAGDRLQVVRDLSSLDLPVGTVAGMEAESQPHPDELVP